MTTFDEVLVPHGTTPTGIGLVRIGEIARLISPCCGTLFYEQGQSDLKPQWSISAWCEGCKLEYTALMFETEAVLYHDAPFAFLGEDKRWLAGALGYDKDELEVTVE